MSPIMKIAIIAQLLRQLKLKGRRKVMRNTGRGKIIMNSVEFLVLFDTRTSDKKLFVSAKIEI